MSFLLALIGILGPYQVVWEDTDIDVVLNTPIEDYVDIPQASLYIEGELIDTEATYIYNGVNRTFITTVQTSYVKTYAIDYEVYFEAYDIRTTTTVYFHVVDEISPRFTYIPSFEINVGDDLPDLLEGLTYTDNYDDIEYLTLKVDSSQVNTNQVGTYKIYYQVYDTSYNRTFASANIKVIDQIPPTITKTDDVILNYGSDSFIIDDYFEFSDNTDDILTISLDDSSVDYSKLGKYSIEITVTDQSNLSTTRSYELVITDHEAPNLIVRDEIILQVFDQEALEHLEDYVILIEDNYDDLDIADVSYIYDIDINRLGSYHIYYEVSDQSNNITKETVEVLVVDETIPEILLLEPLIFDVGNEMPFIETYFDIFDNYYKREALTIDFDYDIDMNKVDKYQLIVTVKDPSKNVAYYYGYIEIIDRVSPEIIQNNEIVITQFNEIDYASYFEFSDQYDDQANITFEILTDDIDYLHIGTYDLIVYAYDLSNNKQTYLTQVYVIDIIDPILTLSTTKVYLNLDHDPIDLTSYISEVSDNYDELSMNDVLIEEDISYNEVNCYEVKYSIEDLSKNREEVILYLYIDDYEQPEVTMTDLHVDMNAAINYLEGIEVIDRSNYEIYYDASYIDTSLEGIQYLTYVIQDERGNYIKHIRKIYIEQDEFTYEIEQFIPVIIVLLASIFSAFYIYKKYH